jgi:hypothetical protein
VRISDAISLNTKYIIKKNKFMKKKLFFIILLHIAFTPVCYSQTIMQDIQNCFVELKNDITLKLDSCRTNPRVGDLHYGSLKYCLINFLIYKESSLLYGQTWETAEKEIDSLNIRFNWKMVYDDEMIERIIQLLNNKYRKDEFEILVNRQWQIKENRDWNRIAMYMMQADTSQIFKYTMDSLNLHRDKNLHKNIYQDEEVFKYMQLDTTTRFRFVLDSVIKSTRKEVINNFFTQYHFNIGGVIKSCASINDERLVEVLINLLNKLAVRTEELTQMLEANETNNEKWKINDEKTNNENIMDAIKATLVRLKIEPYHSDYLKSITHSIEEIKKMYLAGDIEILSEILCSQESFRELSKYLHSSAPTMLTGDDELLGKAYANALIEIKKYIKNKELWDIINKPDFNLEKDRFEIYEWMQKNYGNYEIKKLW